MSEHDNSLALFYFLITTAGAFLLLLLFLWVAKRLADFTNHLRIKRETKHGVCPGAVKSVEMTPSRQPLGDIEDHVALARMSEVPPPANPHKCHLRIVSDIEFQTLNRPTVIRPSWIITVCLKCRIARAYNRNTSLLSDAFHVNIKGVYANIGYDRTYMITSDYKNITGFVDIKE